MNGRVVVNVLLVLFTLGIVGLGLSGQEYLYRYVSYSGFFVLLLIGGYIVVDIQNESKDVIIDEVKKSVDNIVKENIKESGDARRKSQELNKSLKETRDQAERNKIQKDLAQNELDKKNKELDEHKKSKLNLESSIRKSKIELEELQRLNIEKDNHNRNIKDEISRKSDEIEGYTKALSEAQSSIQELDREKNQSEAKIEKLKKDLEKSKKELKKEKQITKKLDIGREFENEVSELYRDKGWTCHMLGSKRGFKHYDRDYKIDLIAFKGDNVDIVQCKFWKNYTVGSEDEIKKMYRDMWRSYSGGKIDFKKLGIDISGKNIVFRLVYPIGSSIFDMRKDNVVEKNKHEDGIKEWIRSINESSSDEKFPTGSKSYYNNIECFRHHIGYKNTKCKKETNKIKT